MNKTAIKNFAVSARKKLIAMAIDKAGIIGITKENIAEPISRGADFAVFPTHFGTETQLDSVQQRQRDNLVSHIKEKGYDSVMEEVAYTWFNRLIAVRFMEVNDFLPSRVRVLSSETQGKPEPDLVTLAPKVDLDFTDTEVDEIYALKDDPRKSGELFKKLFIKQCNALGEILPELFEKTTDYTELLLDLAWNKEDSVVRELLTIDESGFLEAVEIIGWMYQYYNTEPKADTFELLKKNVKITKERIPSATQLFTPDWIVRYMVENSLGRLWIEGHPNTGLKPGWKYYLDEAEQEPDVAEQLEKIREEYKNVKPENIKVIDPCMGSGHILVYAFDVLMQIYVSSGYTESDAAAKIIENNLYGVDIDKRAYQLSYFAVMMKARKYDRRFLTRGVEPNVYAIEESNSTNRNLLKHFGENMSELERNTAILQLNDILDYLVDAKEYGSILKVDSFDWSLLQRFINSFTIDCQMSFEAMELDETQHHLSELIDIATVMMMKYDVVITNPPYMGSSGMDDKLSDYAKKNYPDSKSDLFAVFMERCGQMTKQNGYTAMITQHAWMFLSSFEKLRAKLLHTDTINMAHLGARAFEEIGGEVVQTTSWVQRKSNIGGYQGTYARLVDYGSQREKETAFLAHSELHTVLQENFSKIPGSPISYWVSENFWDAFQNETIGNIAKPRQGLATGCNDLFIRLWYEVNRFHICYHANDTADALVSKKKWFPYNKGGAFRRWYGNNDYIVNWEQDGLEIRNFTDEKGKLRSRPQNTQFYFKQCISWSLISSGRVAFRYKPQGHVFDVSGMSCFADKHLLYLLCLCNSPVVNAFLAVLAPTINYQAGDIANIPVIFDNRCLQQVEEIAQENIDIGCSDWDSFETSWDFEVHPLVHPVLKRNWSDTPTVNYSMYNVFEALSERCETQFNQLKANEEKLNRIFIDIYGLQDELTPEVEDKDVTVRKADLQRDIRSLVSYAVGCMFGRYSLDVKGLAFAGGDWDASNYSTFIPDVDNVLPITDDAYFADDIVTRFCDFVKAVYGAETLEENLDFIAKALGNKGNSSREIIRNYFLNDFYKDHLKIYQKRPIYWMFDSGKENGFKALIYLHRYDQDTVGRVRADYLHKQQGFLENAIANCDYTLQTSQNAHDKADATKKKDKLVKQLAETRLYDQALAHIALQRIDLDLDDGVKENYEKYLGVEVKNEGTKPVKIDLLGKIV